MKEIILYFLVRVFFAIIPQSLPYADEMWQGPEIAHNDVFGYGWKTWEWTRDLPLRSPVYHSLFSLLYHIIKFSKLDNALLVAYSPRILQCAISAVYDYYLVKLLMLEGIRNSKYIILVNYTIWFSLNCFSKTLINTFETVLFTLALYNWILYLRTNSMACNIRCRVLVIFNVMARQSAIIPWMFIWPLDLITSKTNLSGKFKILIQNCITLIVLAATSTICDSLYHGRLTSTFYNFLEFNLLSGMSSFYGVHDKTWFVIQGLPYVQLGWVILFVTGICSYLRKGLYSSQPIRLFAYMLFSIIVLSVSAHKEDRFLLPLFPLIIYFICSGIELLEKLNYLKMKLLLIILGISSNILFFVLMNSYQDIGALTTMSVLRNRNVTSVEFFTQCHRTPFYSFIHKNIPMYFPDCSPTKDVEQLQAYLLHKEPSIYIENRLSITQPSHIVIYNYLLNDNVRKSMRQYKEVFFDIFRLYQYIINFIQIHILKTRETLNLLFLSQKIKIQIFDNNIISFYFYFFFSRFSKTLSIECGLVLLCLIFPPSNSAKIDSCSFLKSEYTDPSNLAVLSGIRYGF